jgi:hypothetical protein
MISLVPLAYKKAGISTKKAYALLNNYSVLQELYWPEKKAGKTKKEKKVVILPPPHQKIDYMKQSNLAVSTLMSNPIISSTKDEEEEAHSNVEDMHITLEEKMDQLSERIISLEKLIQRLVYSQQ